jgi:hypothetical protein
MVIPDASRLNPQETSPVLACRQNVAGGNVRGSLGLPIPGTSLRVVDPQTLAPVEAGSQGLILARGPGVMQVRPSWMRSNKSMLGCRRVCAFARHVSSACRAIDVRTNAAQ